MSPCLYGLCSFWNPHHLGKTYYLLRPCYSKSGLLTRCITAPRRLLAIQSLELSSRPLTQKQHFHSIPRGSSDMLRMETHYTKPSPSSASLTYSSSLSGMQLPELHRLWCHIGVIWALERQRNVTCSSLYAQSRTLSSLSFIPPTTTNHLWRASHSVRWWWC